ncbi:MAG: hypothetical protein ACFCU3_03025 [Verrucomicrobiales bacterium]
MSINISSSNLREALQIKTQIEQLEGKLAALLGGGGAAAKTRTKSLMVNLEEPAAEGLTPTRTRGRRGRRRRGPSPLKGKARPRSPSGPLEPAVLSVLKKKGKPMKIDDILDGLNTAGYHWTCADPKRNLFARIYRMKSVDRAGEGLFSAKKGA